MKKTFNISCNGIVLPFELYSKDYILDELNKNKDLFGRVIEMKNATKAEIRKYYREHYDELSENSRHFAYIKFCKYKEEKKDKTLYGIVGGKTNYTNPDLIFDMKKDKNDKRHARNFFQEENMEWDNTIIIVNHRPSNSEDADKQEALFTECFLQRIFNLFVS